MFRNARHRTIHPIHFHVHFFASLSLCRELNVYRPSALFFYNMPLILHLYHCSALWDKQGEQRHCHREINKLIEALLRIIQLRQYRSRGNHTRVLEACPVPFAAGLVIFLSALPCAFAASRIISLAASHCPPPRRCCELYDVWVPNADDLYS